MSHEFVRSKLKSKRQKSFEAWMKSYWAGVSLKVYEEIEYKEAAVQIAWEVWCKFNEAKS